MPVRTSLAVLLTLGLLAGGCTLLNQGTPAARPTAATAATTAIADPASTAPTPTATDPGTSPPPATSQAPTEATSAPPATTAAPPVVTVTVRGSAMPSNRTQVVATDVLDTVGLGPLQLGLPLATLKQRGYVKATTGNPCLAWETAPALTGLGINLRLYNHDEQLGEISLTSSTIKTRSGAAVGMTIGKVKQIYGTKAVVETKNGNGGPFQVLVVKDTAREVVFMIKWEAQPVSDGDLVTSIVARPYNKDMYGGC